MKAPVGPRYERAPSAETIEPPITAVTKPPAGCAPEVIAMALLGDRATIATVHRLPSGERTKLIYDRDERKATGRLDVAVRRPSGSER